MGATTTGLDQKTIETVKATVPVLQEHGEAITSHFYKIMLENHPELKNVFNQTNQRKGGQPKALANTVYAAAANIEHLEDILPHVKQIAHKHTSLNIKPEQYPIVGKYLLIAIKDVLGEAATDNIIDAWEKAYGVIADVFISVEKEMYEEKQNAPGGWVGFRDFTVVKKIQESEVITSFYLKPADHGRIPAYQPGQYITIKAQIDGETYDHLRQYSLSTAPGQDFLRISVKREDEHNPEGIVSNYLHHQVEEGAILPITSPSGDFVLNETEQKPLILISGGVGLTPLMSMLETVIEEQPEREVIFIHAARSRAYHAMKDKVASIAEANKQVTYYTVYADNTDAAACDKEGRIDFDWLKTVVPTVDASFYLCGPKGFMGAMDGHLRKMNVADNDIHFELFAPMNEIAN
ncbi:NO-inducible flavohemoprotein [Oceanobacillus jeddahense]|uniref:Flavohemoprotein n=1 Tax=Oceanobacillus jeddahense TaxID=1462527 RepID=A0ABY5JUA6_9BACI|nr:NO-inducible flavohemoprotein [Oceanobacillus jeddahense]UUI03676.1 NO-inducible flavohemoprotein [Oceanobacillus jeddahense]